MRILIAEDEIQIAKGLKYMLEKNNFSVDTVSDGVEAMEFFSCTEYDVVVLDIMMPGKNGLEVLREIRNMNSSVPVLMLTAKAEVEDRVLGLESGADDYLPKPFNTKEFIARVKALSRRGKQYVHNEIIFGNVKLNCSSYELICGEANEKLNNKEFQIMELFFRNPHIIFSTEHLMDSIWGLDSDSNIDVVWTHIGYVRKKLKKIGADVEIKTVRGAGYSLEEVR